MGQLFINQIFSDDWMAGLKNEWNKSPQLIIPLQRVAFTAKIGYGFKGEGCARGMLSIVNGVVEDSGEVDDIDLDWDLRASRKNWTTWIESGFGVANLGTAISTNSLEFVKGNYRQMIASLSLGKSFLHHFQLMHKVNSEVNSANISRKGFNF